MKEDQLSKDDTLLVLWAMADAAITAIPYERQSMGFTLACCDLMDAANGHCYLGPHSIQQIKEHLGIDLNAYLQIGRVARLNRPGAITRYAQNGWRREFQPIPA